MRICPSCGRENADDRDFCDCGEYLRWEATQYVEAVEPAAKSAPAGNAQPDPKASAPPQPAPPVAAAADPNMTVAPGAVPAAYPPASGTGAGGAQPQRQQGEAPPGAAVLLLRLPDDDAADPGPVDAAVKPGERTSIVGLIRNESTIVDNYDIAVVGLPEGWWTVAPATAYLVPYGTGGSYEQEIQVHLHPPRSPEAHAKGWPFQVVATSRAYGQRVAEAPASVEVAPYEDVAAKLTPDRASGRLKARFKMTVSNRANAPATVALDGEDQDGECVFRFAEPSVTLPPGRVIEAPFTCFPPKQIWIGRPVDRPIKVTAAPAGMEEPAAAAAGGATAAPPPAPGVFRQKPWLPWWLAIVAPLVIAALVLFLVTRPKQATVPNLTKAASVFDAQKAVMGAGLKWSPQVGQVNKPGAQPGTIVNQAPAAGKHVKKGTLVSVQVAVASGSSKVPSVVGRTPVAADQLLRASGFVLGTVSPQPPNPTGKIASQIPGGNSAVAKGTPVAVFLQPVAVAGKGGAAGKKAAGAAAAAGAGAAGGAAAAGAKGSGSGATGSGAGQITVPPVKGTVLTAAAQLSQLGLVPSSTKRLNPAPANTLFGTSPAAGQKVKVGTAVTLLVSAGFPSIAYDDTQSVKVVNGATSRPTLTVPLGTLPQSEPSWSSDGKFLAYVQGNQIFKLANQKGAHPVAVTDAAGNYRDPSFAPTRDNVLAFIDRKSGTGKLCFGALGPFAINKTCTSAPGFDLGGQIAWAPNGSAILVRGSKKSDDKTFGLIEFVSNVPFSTQASNWGQGQMVTDDSKPGQGVIAGQWSPDGKQLGLVTNIGTHVFHLALTSPNDFTLGHAKFTAQPACELSWRSDGKEIALRTGDLECDPPPIGPIGDIVGVTTSNPDAPVKPIVTNATNPSWQPVSLGG